MPEYTDPQQNKVTPDTKPLKKGKTEIVKDVISKGRTMTGQKPDEIILNPVLEAKEKRAVFAFGRFNPPTIGHEKLIHKVEDTAKSQGAEAHIIASHTEGNAKNPLPKEKKVEYLKKIAAKGTNVTGSSSEHPTLLHHLANLHKNGVHHITMVAGDDRVKEYHDLIHKYNGVEGRHGTFNFKSINVVSAGARDPDAEGAEGMSGTKMREHARSGNMKAFKSGLPKALHPHAKEIADQIKSVKEDIDDVFDSFIVETAIEEIGSIYDVVISEQEKLPSKIDHSNTHFRDDGTTAKTILFKHDTPGEPNSSLVKDDVNYAFEAWVDDENPEPKQREVFNRHGQDRKKIVLVPRGDADRKDCDRPYRQQSIVKKIVDEGKKMSPWDKMVKAMPKLKDSEERAQAAKAGLQQAGKDYQAILDREAEAKKKTNESVNSSSGGDVRGFGYVTGNPDGESSGYVGQNIADADTRDNIIKAHINTHFAMHMVDQKVTKEEKINEDLRKWFKDKWVRMDTKGNIKGDCAREPGEGKPKCLPLAKARAMEKDKRAAAAQRKRREDPVADRPGKGGAPINVKTEEFEYIEEKNKPTNPSLWARAKSLAKSKFDVYPSAYANGWAAKWYKSKGGGWKSVSEETDSLDEKSIHSSEMQKQNRKTYYRHRKLADRHLSKHSRNVALGMYRNTAFGHRVHEDVTNDPVSHLEDKLNTATDKSYDGIDKLMRQVANEHNIDVHDLHDMWVKKAGCTPDEYVKEARIYFGKNRERYAAQRKPLSPEAEKIMKDAETKISQSAVPSKQAIKDRQTKTRADYEKEIPSDYNPKISKA
jgi:hypothetical protein